MTGSPNGRTGGIAGAGAGECDNKELNVCLKKIAEEKGNPEPACNTPADGGAIESSDSPKEQPAGIYRTVENKIYRIR